MTISFSGGTATGKSLTVDSFEINGSGHLIVTYSDNTIVDLGLVVGHDGSDGTNFYPNLVGDTIPTSTFALDKPAGWSYLYLGDPVTIYFKTNNANEEISIWKASVFGKGDTGETGRPFVIDGSGSVLPTDTSILVDGYTFYLTTDGSIWIYKLNPTSWDGPYQFRGPQGIQGRFIIDEKSNVFPSITDKQPGYTFYNEETGHLYYVIEDSNGQKSWDTGILFRGPIGEQGERGLTGNAGSDANNIYAIKNIIDTSYENALLVIGKVPAGYLVTRIEVTIENAYDQVVNELTVRFGGTIQSEDGSTDIAGPDYFDINTIQRYIVDEVNHEISQQEEILSCVFNESVNNSEVGLMTIICTIAKQLPITPIEDNI
jgi:hypothetical protein